MNSPDIPDIDEDHLIQFHAPGAGKAGLVQLVSRRAQEASKHARDFAARKVAWIDKLGELFDRIEHDWLADLSQQGQITLTRGEIELHEELIGAYRAPTLRIQVADAMVVLVPVGTFVSGASGRVDMKGPNGVVLLLLESADAQAPFEQRDFTWNIVNRSPRVTRTPLVEDTFSDALTTLI